MLSTGRACPHKLNLMYLHHWKPGAESVHLVAGRAFASGLEGARRAFYVDGKPPGEAEAIGLGDLLHAYGEFEAPETESKSALRTAGALEYYFSVFPLGADGATPHHFGPSRGIEFSFAEPLPVLHPVTGEPLIFCGRADMAADSFGGLWLYDEKTTKSLGASWANQWIMRSQFVAYCWGFRQYGFKAQGMVVRGIAILKESYNHAQHLQYIPDWRIDQWLAQTVRDLERFKHMWEEDQWDMNLDHSCTEYGGCPFASKVCSSSNYEEWLPVYFHQRRWDPLTREEVMV